MDPTDHSDGCVELLAEDLRKVATYNIIPVRGQKNFLKIHSCGVPICGRNTSYMRQTTAGDYYTPIISGGKKDSSDKIPDDLKHYTDSNDYNRIFYHQLNDNMEQIIQALLSDSDKLLELCGTDYEEVTEYQLFLRCLSDQTVVENGKRRLRTKEDGTMNSTALQNPSDPDATYRNKAGKLHRGYVANLEETVDKNGSVVTDYQYDKNIQWLLDVAFLLFVVN